MDSGIVASPLIRLQIRKWESFGSFEDLGFKHDIQRLRSLLASVNAVLDDAEYKSEEGGDLSLVKDAILQSWLSKVKDAAFEADDVVDELQIEAERRIRNVLKSKVCDFFSARNTLLFRVSMGSKIRGVVGMFVNIERWVPTISFESGKMIFGRDEEKERVIQQLLDMDHPAGGVTIVGMEGVGKTTLARLVYTDERINCHFHCRMWISVAQDYEPVYLIKDMIERLTHERCSLQEIEALLQLLHEKLEGKRVFLVLDDVRVEDTYRLDVLDEILKNITRSGSKIMVTTRNQRVAHSLMLSSQRLNNLSDYESWSMFKNMMFTSGKVRESSEFKEIGRKIVSKCGGRPLAIKAIVRYLEVHPTVAAWLNVAEQFTSVGREVVMEELGLSYQKLPAHLKQCFSYLALFPQHYQIDRMQLIQSWIAQGFVRCTAALTAEEIGNAYFNDFLESAMLQEAQRDEFGGIALCTMHNLMHELARFLADDEAIVDADLGIDPNGYRYSSVLFSGNFSSSIKKIASEAKQLRSLRVFVAEQYPIPDFDESSLKAVSNLFKLRELHLSNIGMKNFPRSVGNITRLRYLNLSNNKITKLPDSCLGNLKQLRFLDLSGNLITSLPKSITTLYHLEAMNLRYCKQLQELPDEMSNLQSLRHLDILGCEGLKFMPPGFGELVSLHTLPLFITGKERGQSLVELKNLWHLRGLLRIKGLHNVTDEKEAMEANLMTKQGLQHLELFWNRDTEDSTQSVENFDKDVLENLQPYYGKLMKLTIVGYDGGSLPDWLIKTDLFSSYVSLVEVSIHSLRRCKNLPLLGQLPSLKRLDISHMDAITEFGDGFGDGGTFPSLSSLTLCDLPSLEQWFLPHEEDMFPHLSFLEISFCPNLVVRPHLPSSVKELVMLSSNKNFLGATGGLQALSKLKKLSITGFTASASGWDGLQYLTSLEELTVSCCPKLTYLPEALIQLQFSSLRKLVLECNMNLKSLGGGGGEAESHGSLPSLQCLVLKCCNNLEMLPEMNCLAALQQLIIEFCPILAMKCEKEKGEYWHKIAHIPAINFS